MSRVTAILVAVVLFAGAGIGIAAATAPPDPTDPIHTDNLTITVQGPPTVGESTTLVGNSTLNASVPHFVWDVDSDGIGEMVGQNATWTPLTSGSQKITFCALTNASEWYCTSTNVTIAESPTPPDAVYAPGSAAAAYDANSDGQIQIDELATAAGAYGTGDLSTTELASVAVAYAA